MVRKTMVNFCSSLVGLMVTLSGFMKAYEMMIIPPPQFRLVIPDCHNVGRDAGAAVVSNNAILMRMDAVPRHVGMDDNGGTQPRIVQLKQGSGLEYWDEGELKLGTFMQLNSFAPSLRIIPSERRKGGETTVVIDVGQIVGIWEDQGPNNVTAWTNLLDSVQDTMREIHPLRLNLDDLWKAASNVSNRGRWVVVAVVCVSIANCSRWGGG